MNKKIKFIEIFQKYVNGEQMPKTIKRGSSVLDYDNKDKKYYERGSEKCIYLSIENFKELENEFEILEDNTEEIEEIPQYRIDNCTDYNYCYLAEKYNELAKAVNAIKKDKNIK